MNPQQVQTKRVTHTFFPPEDGYFLTLYSKTEFQLFLETNATTTTGMQDVAKYYNVGDILNDYIQGKSFENPAWHYFMLLTA